MLFWPFYINKRRIDGGAAGKLSFFAWARGQTELLLFRLSFYYVLFFLGHVGACKRRVMSCFGH